MSSRKALFKLRLFLDLAFASMSQTDISTFCKEIVDKLLEEDYLEFIQQPET